MIWNNRKRAKLFWLNSCRGYSHRDLAQLYHVSHYCIYYQLKKAQKREESNWLKELFRKLFSLIKKLN